MPTSLRKLRPRINPALGTVLLLLALNLLNYLDRYILNGAQPLVQGEFHATDQQMGALTTAFFLTYMIFAPLSGWLGDWYRRKPLIIIGAIIWSLATLGTAFVHTYATFYVSRALVGIGEATFGIYAPAILADFYPDRDRNRILSIFYLAIPVGAALGYLAGGELGSLWSWRAPYLVCAVPGLIIAALYGVWGREPERGAKDRVRPAPKRADSWDALERIVKRRLRLFTMGAFLTAIGLALDHLHVRQRAFRAAPPAHLQKSGVPDLDLWSGHHHVCARRNLRLGSHVPASRQRLIRGQCQSCRWRHHCC